MKKLIYPILFLITSLPSLSAQGVGTWQTYLPYHTTTKVAEGNNYVFAVADGSLYSVSKDASKTIQTYSKIDGLSDTQITQLGYNAEVDKLIVCYSNGNIDLMSERIYNIPALMNNTNIQDKTINNLYFHNEFAYLAAEFGVICVDMKKEEIAETYRLNNAVYAVCLNKDMIYAATDKGVLRGNLKDNLVDIGNWNTEVFGLSDNNEKEIHQICLFQDMLFFFVKENGIYYRQANGSMKTLRTGKELKGMTVQNGQLIAYTNTAAYIYTSVEDYDKVSTGTIHDIASLKEQDTYWIAAGEDGLKGIKKSGNNYEIILSDITINSPKREYAAFLKFHKEKLMVAGGDRWLSPSNYPGTLMVYEDNKWYNFDEKLIEQQSGTKFRDVTSVAVDPQNENRYFASTWRYGIFEFEKNEFVRMYDHTNTNGGLTSQSSKETNVRMDGLCFDKNNNLWMTNSEVNDPIRILKSDGKWAKISSVGNSDYARLNAEYIIDKILITRNNHKWVNLLRTDENRNNGVLIFDDNGTIEDTSDDYTRFVSKFNMMSNGQQQSVDASFYYCITEDKNGVVWIGTNVGPLICENPANALLADRNLLVRRIIRTGEDGLPYYFLDSENVKAIAVDGSNRKWLGTETAGVIVLSEDGSEIIEEFTTANSGLISNNIKSIAINDATGEVFIGTDKGIVSYMSGATTGSESYSEVYAYPNPVRPEYDQVTITGLMADSNIKITDISGNIIIQGKSLGGQYTWNCRNKRGDRVATGIYLVLAHTPEAGESVVTKVMVIK
ncbi:two-component regulator propeller domain-containing protein [Parabacteroides sp. PF5-9]|uniref:type IX secretion system anionic LPS delivery protein PorZ n=1 Tax=Parabacteroides sp. PF5-9 TaxID=1742404 RepID=UPI00247555B3|nr:two-component regulator propeller domain-containing protein [Parabacteroides sp. PF5-9]MDH6356753.1 ligand-binding sensor domain-containing protein [Parabacteroides sp. PF5-9]